MPLNLEEELKELFGIGKNLPIPKTGKQESEMLSTGSTSVLPETSQQGRLIFPELFTQSLEERLQKIPVSRGLTVEEIKAREEGPSTLIPKTVREKIVESKGIEVSKELNNVYKNLTGQNLPKKIRSKD